MTCISNKPQVRNISHCIKIIIITHAFIFTFIYAVNYFNCWRTQQQIRLVAQSPPPPTTTPRFLVPRSVKQKRPRNDSYCYLFVRLYDRENKCNIHIHHYAKLVKKEACILFFSLSFLLSPSVYLVNQLLKLSSKIVCVKESMLLILLIFRPLCSWFC